MVITSTIATWPHEHRHQAEPRVAACRGARSPRSGWGPVPSIRPRRGRDPRRPRRASPPITTAESAIATAPPMIRSDQAVETARSRRPCFATSSSDGPSTAPIVAAQTIQPMTVPRCAGGIERGGAVAGDAVGAVADAEASTVQATNSQNQCRADGGRRQDGAAPWRRHSRSSIACRLAPGPRPRIRSDDPMAVPRTVAAPGRRPARASTCSASAMSVFTV